MTRKASYPSDAWGTPEHLAWEKAQRGGRPRPVQHPTGCDCRPCAARWAATKRYLDAVRGR